MTALTTATINDIVADLSRNLGDTRMDADTVAANETLYRAAMQYAQNYSGSFAFMVSMQLQVIGTANQAGQWLTKGQAAAVINCAVADYRHNHKANAVKVAQEIINAPAPATTQAVADGWYTIVGSKGGHRTLRLTTISEDQKGNGVRQWLSYLSGPDNENNYKSIGTVDGTTVRLFKKNEGQYSDIVAAAKYLVRNASRIGEFGKNYALRSGNCARCNRRLTVPASIGNGYGPKCSELLGL
jgi:hypothetical protein